MIQDVNATFQVFIDLSREWQLGSLAVLIKLD